MWDGVLGKHQPYRKEINMYITHLIFFGSLSLGLYIVSKKIILSASLAVTLGIAKELCDGLLHMGTCDVVDMLYNVVGIALSLYVGKVCYQR